MNKSEQEYSASEEEILALVRATKIRCYLYGKQFLIRTVHSALSYFSNFADHNPRLTRWSLKLSELDFFVEQRPGPKIAHVDALSQHVCAISREEPLSRETFLREQRQEEFCSKQKLGTYIGMQSFFTEEEGLMYRRQASDKHQLVVPITLISDVVRENCNPLYRTHPGVKKTYELLPLNYWRPDMYRSIEDYVKNCDSCQRRKGDREFIAPLGKLEETSTHFQFTSLDVTGQYPMTTRKNTYLLTLINHFTRYVLAFPKAVQTAANCARVYANQIITQQTKGHN
jgi:hypothetical protein